MIYMNLYALDFEDKSINAKGETFQPKTKATD